MIGGALVVPVVAAVVHLNGETAQDRTFDRSVDRGGVRKYGGITRTFKHWIVLLGSFLQLLTLEKRAYTGGKALKQLITLRDGVTVGDGGGVWHCGTRCQCIKRALRHIGDQQRRLI